jgi:hypothetical protein
MTTLLAVLCSFSQEEAAHTTVEEGCKEAGGLLIGRLVNEETHEVLLLIQLFHTACISKHTKVLSHARQQAVIASFRFVTCDLLKISFDPSVDTQEQMRGLPLRPGESWFPANHDPHQIYVSIRRPLMEAKQAAWLLAHGIAWAYV